MKKGIHPEYHKDVKVTCVCGNTFITGSTKPALETEICSNCHPFYTGKQKLIDSSRRVEKYEEKIKKQKDLQKVYKNKSKKEKRQKRATSKKQKTEK